MLSKAQYELHASAGYTHIPLAVEVLSDLDTPLSTYLKLCRDPHGFLFESLQGGETWGRYSIIGLPSNSRLEVRGSELCFYTDRQVHRREHTNRPLDAIRHYQRQFKVPVVDGLPPFSGGLVGYFGYNTVHFATNKPPQADKPKPLGLPDIVLMVAEELLVFDNLTGRLTLIVHAKPEQSANAYEIGVARLDELIERLRQPFIEPHIGSFSNTPSRPRLDSFTEAGFKSAVGTCLDYIRAGDAFQIVLSQRMKATFKAPPIALYRALRTINPSPYMLFMDFADFQLASSSPEILVRSIDGQITLRPLAGTRKRGKSIAEDEALARELLADPKELAEHLMLIDLGRNDIGRVSQYGSVKVTQKMAIEKFSHVMHIVSNLTGRLQNEVDCIDVLAATFPAGTLSGAPKIRALEIIEELEPDQREIYSGAIGYLGWHGNIDTAIAIRTAVIQSGQIYVQAGAGIVADSVAELEWQETLNKAHALLAAASLAEKGLSGPMAA